MHKKKAPFKVETKVSTLMGANVLKVVAVLLNYIMDAKFVH